MADRFYTPHPLGPGSFVLEGPEAHHLTVVRRFVPGDRVVLFNGDGRDYLALILAVDKKNVLFDVSNGEECNRELNRRIEIASALPKGDRCEFLVEKLTELGVARFTPLITDRAVVRPKPGRMERFQRTVIEASKQCGRSTLMEIGLPAEWPAFTLADWLPQDRLVLHTGTDDKPELPQPGQSVLVAVGPEGGFTDDEVELARSAGWRVASLGPRAFRMETAAIAIAAWLAVNSLADPTSRALP
ncbi:MAG TPA: RsmE family RNA methyltransferase [Fimbriiglobus sp.]|jgi:16S rRNA (uracil1498-N3)-methyltransferase